MGRLFVDTTPEQESAFIEERRKFAFLAACRWPLSWLMPARRHKRAADILYEIAYNAHKRDLARFLAQVESGFPNGSSSRKLEGQELLDQYNMELLGDYFLLAGYALECVLKGCLLAMLPELVNDEKRLDKLVSTHNLCQLCHDCAILLSSEERQILELITRHIVWGKYAGPLKLEDMPSPVNPEDDKTKSLRIANPFHERRAQLLVNGVFHRGLSILNSFHTQEA